MSSTSFLEKDLPALISYDDTKESVIIESMDQIQWHRAFTVKARQWSQADNNLSDKKQSAVIEIPDDHWIKEQVDHYYIPLGPLSRFYFSSRVKEEIIDSFKRAIQWSTHYGENDTIDPDALLLNLIHQIFGIDESAQKKETNIPLSFKLAKYAPIVMNRYLIDYKNKDSQEIKSFLSRAPNALLAKIELDREVKEIVEVLSINQVSPIESKSSAKKFTYSVIYRLRTESINKMVYYLSDLEIPEEVFVEFANEYPEAIVLSVRAVITDSSI